MFYPPCPGPKKKNVHYSYFLNDYSTVKYSTVHPEYHSYGRRCFFGYEKPAHHHFFSGSRGVTPTVPPSLSPSLPPSLTPYPEKHFRLYELRRPKTERALDILASNPRSRTLNKFCSTGGAPPTVLGEWLPGWVGWFFWLVDWFVSWFVEWMSERVSDWLIG